MALRGTETALWFNVSRDQRFEESLLVHFNTPMTKALGFLKAPSHSWRPGHVSLQVANAAFTRTPREGVKVVSREQQLQTLPLSMFR